MESGEHTAVIVSVLVVAGMLLGVLVGRCGASGSEVVVQTTTARGPGTVRTTTKTVTRTKTKTKTITAPVDTGADTVETDVPPTGTTDSADCSPDYLGACVPADATEVKCSDIPERNFDSVGDDPYGLDPDGDSFACE